MPTQNRPSIFCKLFFAQLFLLVCGVAVGIPLLLIQQAPPRGLPRGWPMVMALLTFLVFGYVAVVAGRYVYQLLTNHLPADKLPRMTRHRRITAIVNGGIVVSFNLCMGGLGNGDRIAVGLFAFGASLGLSSVLWGIHETVRAMRGDEEAGKGDGSPG
jgi:hypothetical protein